MKIAWDAYATANNECNADFLSASVNATSRLGFDATLPESERAPGLYDIMVKLIRSRPSINFVSALCLVDSNVSIIKCCDMISQRF